MLSFEDAQEVIMTVAEQLEQKGIQKGIKQGIEQGKILVASKLLYKKFGHAAKPYQDRLASLSTDELEILIERLITESSLDDIFQGFSWSNPPTKLS